MVKTKEKSRYIFPSKIAKKMKTITTRAQLEASMMSMTLIMIGLFLFAVYQIFYGDYQWWFKGLIIFNILCGFVLIGSTLVTSYQQYVNHLEIMGIDPDEEKRQIKAQGNIFKRIAKAYRNKRAKKRQSKDKMVINEYPTTMKHNYSSDDLLKLYKVQMVDNMEYSKEILENQGKVDIKPDYKPKKVKKIIDNSKKLKVSMKDLINEQREMLEQ